MRELKTVGKWDLRFLEMAKLVASWSKDESSKVGCVITDGKFIVSVGFNGAPAKVSDTHKTREDKLAVTLHSEVNSILASKRDLNYCTLYCTHAPCSNCAAVICQVGITKVYCIHPSKDFLARWGASVETTSRLFKEKGIDFFSVSL